MRSQPAVVHVRMISPATWCVLALLLLLLGALSLFLMGCADLIGIDDWEAGPTCPPGQVLEGEVCVTKSANHYTCACQCTKGFSINATVEVVQDVNVRQDPGEAGVILASAPIGSVGTIVDGPVQADLAGTPHTWWKIQWDPASGLPDGWSTQSDPDAGDFLKVTSSDVMIAKTFDVCVPPNLNGNLQGGTAATEDDVKGDCMGRVKEGLGGDFPTGPQLPPGSECGCAETEFSETAWASECDAGCAIPSGVCLTSNSDPPQPTPEPLSAALFATTSVCQVTRGTATLSVGGLEPKVQPSVEGFMQIHGRPCPAGQRCQVGLGYQLTFGEIEFASGSIFIDDPKFVGLGASGATEPNAITLSLPVPTDTGYSGAINPGQSLTSARGRRSRSTQNIVSVVRNTQAIEFEVDWAHKTCGLSGNLVGGVKDVRSGAILDLHVDLAIEGVLVNQPPVANAGRDQTVECTSPTETLVTLNGSASSDPDDNIAFYTWRRGSDTGPLVGDPSAIATRTTRQRLGQTRYFLRVVDGDFAADSASVNVNVIDTTAPVIRCNAPANIGKHDGPMTFRATATDSCGPAPSVVIDTIDCFKLKNDRVEKEQACRASIQGDSVIIDTTGGADLVRWQTHAVDGANNVGRQTCEVLVEGR